MTLSIYIPRIFSNISKSQVAKVFEDLELGEIERIDMIPYTNAKGVPLYRAFVYIQWSNSGASVHLQEKIKDPDQQAKIMYQEPWFWILLPNKNPMTAKEVLMERRVESIEYHLNHLTEAYNFQRHVTQKQGKLLNNLGEIIFDGKFASKVQKATQTPEQDSVFPNPEKEWFESLEWLDRVLVCENLKEDPYMQQAYEAKYLRSIGREGLNYNAQWEDYIKLVDMLDIARQGIQDG